MKLIKLLALAIITLVIGSVTVSNRSVDESLIVADLTQQITSLQNKNTILRAEVASAGALAQINDKIREAGFVSTPTVAALHTAATVALR